MKRILYLLLLLFCISACHSVQIDGNELGIKFKRFDGGIDPTKTYESGKHLLFNWNHMITYNLDPKLIENEITVMNENEIDLVYTLRFSLNPTNLGYLQLHIGEDYDRFITTNTRKAIYNEFKNLDFASLTNMDWTQIEKSILQDINESFKIQYFNFEYLKIVDYEVRVTE